jgi:hypothetical protein
MDAKLQTHAITGAHVDTQNQVQEQGRRKRGE